MFRSICYVSVLLAGCVSAQTQVVLWNRSADIPGMQAYVELFLDLTEKEYGPYTLALSQPLEQGRAVKEMQSGELLNLAVMGNEESRERNLLPIYYPLDHGLLGMRVCVVRQKEERLLENIRNLSDLKKRNLIIGSGSHWPDTPILLANNVVVAAAPRYDSLIQMLSAGRFDCLNRSLNEIEAESQKYQMHNLVVDRHVALVYPLANFVYVSPRYPKLHERLKLGLAKAQESEKMDEIYISNYSDVIDKESFFKRRIIILENPTLTNKARAAINENGLMSFEQATQ